MVLSVPAASAETPTTTTTSSFLSHPNNNPQPRFHSRDPKMIAEMMDNVGGGWHGQGWLGSRKWTVSRTSIGADGLCKCCGEKLALIDLDPAETEKFAESVASIAIKREKNSSFQKFQRWLDYYGPFEAVVDAANVGLFSLRKFRPSKVNAVVNGIRQMLPSRKWPLIAGYDICIIGE